MIEKILICGKARAGKSTFAAMLAERLGISWAETSDVLIELLTEREGVSKNEVLNRKEVWRPKLVQIGQELCERRQYPYKILEEKGFQLLVGIRTSEEFLAANNENTLSIWVDRESGTVPDNVQVQPSDCSVVIPNRSSLKNLEILADEVKETVLKLTLKRPSLSI